MDTIYKSFIMLTNANVVGKYRYRDLFQLLPAPSDFPRAPCLEAHHPCLLELKYNFTFDPGVKMPGGEVVPDWIQKKDLESKIIREISAIFGVFSLSKFVCTQDSHSWTLSTTEGAAIGTEWRQLSYFVRGHKHDISGFTDSSCQPIEEVETSRLYNLGARYIGSDFSIPDFITGILDAYYALDQEDKDAILRSASLFDSAIKIKAISSSISFASFVSSIESLVDYHHKDVKFERCKECSAPRYSVTKKFTEFLKAYSSESNELVRFYKSAYGHRSKILHAGALFLGEHIPANWAESDWEAYHMNSGIERICRIAFTNWLLERAQSKVAQYVIPRAPRPL